MEEKSVFVIDERFAEAFIQSEHKLMGMAVLPFCSWHKLQLEIIQSPVLLGEPITLANIWQMAKICQTVYPIAAVFPAKNTWFARWGWFLRFRKFNVVQQAKAVSEYLKDHNSGAKLWDTKKSGQAKERDCDDNLDAVSYYLNKTKCSEVEAWMLPLGKLSWYNLMFARMDGAEIHFWTPSDDVAFAAHVEKREAKIEATAQQYAVDGMEIDAARERAKTEYWTEVNKNLGKI